MSKYPWQNIDLQDENAAKKLLKLVGNNKKVLEVGCASGYVSKIMKEQLNCAVTGIEVSPEEAGKAEQYCERVIIGDIEAINMGSVFAAEKFDVITFGDVLEHMKAPDKVLKTASNFLSDSGYILASIPNIAHISVALELLEGKFEYRQLGILDDTHLRFFTKKSILLLFRNAGYDISVWDRVIMKPEDTEFKTVLEAYPYSLLSFLGPQSEALTYQFVIKAIPYNSDKEFGQFQKGWEQTAVEELREKLVEKEKQVREKENKIKEKETQLNAILNSRCWRMTAFLRCLKNFMKK